MGIREVNVTDGRVEFIEPVDPEPALRSMEHHEWKIRQAVKNGHPLISDWQDFGWYRDTDGKMVYCWEHGIAPRSVAEKLIAEGVSGEWRRSGPLALEEFVVDDENSHPDIPKKNDWLKGRPGMPA